MMEFDMGLLQQIISVLLLLLSIGFGGYLLKFKRKLNAATELITWLNNALEDDKVSEDEWNAGLEKLGALLHDCP